MTLYVIFGSEAVIYIHFTYIYINKQNILRWYYYLKCIPFTFCQYYIHTHKVYEGENNRRSSYLLYFWVTGDRVIIFNDFYWMYHGNN